MVILRNPERQFMWRMLKTILNFLNFIKHKVPHHVFYMKKVIFLREMITKKKQNAVKSGLNIIPIGDVKMR